MKAARTAMAVNILVVMGLCSAIASGATGSGTSGIFAIDNSAGTADMQGQVIGLNAQGQAEGTLAGATVSIPGVGSVVTNSSGEYSFASVLEGVHTVTVEMAGYLTVSREITLGAGQKRTENFSLTADPGGDSPVASGFSSPDGKHFIEGMPGVLTFSTNVDWNGTPGTVRFNIAGLWHEATVQDLGGGMAEATLTVAAPALIVGCSELTIEVTNGEGKKTSFNTGVHFFTNPRPYHSLVPGHYSMDSFRLVVVLVGRADLVKRHRITRQLRCIPGGARGILSDIKIRSSRRHLLWFFGWIWWNRLALGKSQS